VGRDDLKNKSHNAAGDAEAGLCDQRVGGKYVRMLSKHLKRLNKAAAHPNRVLQYSDLLTLLLMSFFNPTVRSLRTMEAYSQSAALQSMLCVEKAARSTLCDANRCLDAHLLEGLIKDLRRRLPDLSRSDRQLEQLLRQTRIVDGSLFSVAANVQWALRRRKSHASVDNRFVRLDLQFCGVSGLPEGLEINGKGTSEARVARRHIEPGLIYVADRGLFSFAYIKAIAQGGSDFVLRLRSPTSERFQVETEAQLNEADRAAGVLGDRTGHLEPSSPYIAAPSMLLREVMVLDEHNPQRPVRLLTTLLDVPAQMIGQLYRHRWQIELFFRWLKVHAHFRHVISHNKNGLTLGFYVAVIAVLLMYLHTGRKVSKYAYACLCWVAQGLATMQDIIPMLEAREREKELERGRLARKKAEKSSM
jgi:hypothetical protein